MGFHPARDMLEAGCTHLRESNLCISFQLRVQRCHKNILKSAMVGEFTPQKSENAVYQKLPPPPRANYCTFTSSHWTQSCFKIPRESYTGLCSVRMRHRKKRQSTDITTNIQILKINAMATLASVASSNKNQSFCKYFPSRLLKQGRPHHLRWTHQTLSLSEFEMRTQNFPVQDGRTSKVFNSTPS